MCSLSITYKLIDGQGCLCVSNNPGLVKSQIFLASNGLIVAVHLIKLHPLKNVKIIIQMLLRRFLPLTSTNTSLPKTIRVRKQPIIALYFESENERKFYNLEARYKLQLVIIIIAEE